MDTFTLRWKVIGYSGYDEPLMPFIIYDDSSQEAINRIRKFTGGNYTGADWTPLPKIKPYDARNQDGHYGEHSAIPCEWPAGISVTAKRALKYLDGTAYLFRYMGKYVVTDEGGWLTPYGKGQSLGFPRATVDYSVEALNSWLEHEFDVARKNRWPMSPLY